VPLKDPILISPIVPPISPSISKFVPFHFKELFCVPRKLILGVLINKSQRLKVPLPVIDVTSIPI
jgi:hypothetical protein